MEPMQSMGKMVLLIGLLMVVIGGLMMGAGKLFNFGRLPGDIYIQKGNFAFFFPLASMIILSLVLTFLANLLFKR